jgi:hypothetical protein
MPDTQGNESPKGKGLTYFGKDAFSLARKMLREWPVTGVIAGGIPVTGFVAWIAAQYGWDIV